MSFNIRTLSSEQLSEHFSGCVQKRAAAEREAFYLDENRKRLLDVLTLQIMDDDSGISHAKASSRARASEEFKTHLEGQAVAIEDRWQAYGDFKECDFEIKRRLQLSFSKNREWSTGNLNT